MPLIYDVSSLTHIAHHNMYKANKMLRRNPLVFSMLMIIVVASLFIVYYLVAENMFNPAISTTISATNTSSSTGLRGKILEIVEEVRSMVEEIRGLKFPEQMQVKIINRTWVLEHWAPPPKPPKDLLYREMAYKLSLLVPPDFSIVKGERQWAASFMAATAGYTLYVVEDNFNVSSPVARRALAHELTHILQYHYFHPTYPSTLDGRLAVLALVEGDADFVADTYCNLTNIPPRPKLGIPLDNPYIALQSFPYIFGEDFVRYLYDKGGWKLVNKAYSRLPKSTEQVINPQKYLENEEPVHTILKVNETTNPVYTDTMGEYYILLVLASKIDLKEAYKAAQGWGGDVLALFHDNYTSTWRLYWNITWDTAGDAEEFYQTLLQVLKSMGALIEEDNNKTIAIIWNYTITITINERNTLITSRTQAE